MTFQSVPHFIDFTLYFRLRGTSRIKYKREILFQIFTVTNILWTVMRHVQKDI